LQPSEAELARRTFLIATGLTSAGLVLTTVGQTFAPLQGLVLFAPRRPDIGSQGLPVNKSARDAGVIEDAIADGYRLRVDVGNERRMELSTEELERLPMHEATLPIACVEGWSKTATWRGVRMRDLLARTGVDRLGDDRAVEAISLEDGLYGSSRLTAAQASDRDTLLALFVNGERLNLDHGYPVRLIAPNRPGVMQTKWVHRVVVR
jgi:DMSO/TMAO reductase YedYZ molybdopterin-dependent catalytic subunit